MVACIKCETTRYVAPCNNCAEPICADCKAGPSAATIASPFANFCSEDCRDGADTRAELRMKTCDRCGGAGKRRVYNDRHPSECWSCNGTGKVHPRSEPKKPMAPPGKSLVTCPQCGGKYQFNVLMCQVCNGDGVIAV